MSERVTQEDQGALTAILCRYAANGARDELLELVARHRIAAEQRGKLEGARLAIEAAASNPSLR